MEIITEEVLDTEEAVSQPPGKFVSSQGAANFPQHPHRKETDMYTSGFL